MMSGFSRKRRQRQSKARASLRPTLALSPLFGIPVCKRRLWPLQGWHFETATVKGGRFFPLKILSLGRDRRFGVRSYCVRVERQVTLRLWSASALVSLHKFFSCLKQFGYPSLAADYTLALSSLMAAVVELHEKRPALPEKLKELQTKGRKLTQTLKHQRTMRVKRMKVAEGRRLNIGQFPNFHRSGSIKGMKKLYYGEDCLLVRCGNYIYNVTSEPSIYNQATI